MRRAVEQAVLGSLVLVGCLVAGVDVDPSLSADESGEIISGSAGVSGQGPTGGTTQGGTSSRGGASGQGGGERGGGGPVGGSDSGGSDPGGSDAGGMDAGGTDAGGMDAGGTGSGGRDSGGGSAGAAGMGGTALGGAGVGGGGTAAGGAGTGGVGAGGAGVGGSAGAGGSAGSSGGGVGGAGCANIAPGMPCANEGLTCVDAPCGFGSVGRSTCSCPSASPFWSCSACNYAGTPFETQPMISLCYPNTTDGVQCSIPQQVCGPVAGEYCVCLNPSGTSATWDCSPPPLHWGCTGLSVSMTLTGGSTAHDHLPLTEGEQAAITANIRSAFATSGVTLPVDMGHTHNVPLQPVHVTTLRNGGAATDLVTDTVDGHFHIYSLMCLP